MVTARKLFEANSSRMVVCFLATSKDDMPTSPVRARWRDQRRRSGDVKRGRLRVQLQREHAGHGTLEKFAVDCVEDGCQHDRAPLVDRGIY
jgi:hypothetical protein